MDKKSKDTSSGSEALQNAALHSCRGGGSSTATKVFCFLSISISCYFFYRVTALESRVNYLEKEFEKISSLLNNEEMVTPKLFGLSQEDGVLSRRRRNTPECVCPPGNLLQLYVRREIWGADPPTEKVFYFSIFFATFETIKVKGDDLYRLVAKNGNMLFLMKG